MEYTWTTHVYNAVLFFALSAGITHCMTMNFNHLLRNKILYPPGYRALILCKSYTDVQHQLMFLLEHSRRDVLPRKG